jgi:hypothetical protein
MNIKDIFNFTIDYEYGGANGGYGHILVSGCKQSVNSKKAKI